MSTLRSAISRLAPAARFRSKGGRGSSVIARRTFFNCTFGSKSPVYWEHFSLKSPETWFAIFSLAVAAAYKIKVQMINHDKRIRPNEEEEKRND